MIRQVLIASYWAQWLLGASQPVVRVALDSPRPIIVGQAVRLNVTVLVPNYFTGEPKFPQITIANAIVVQPQETPRNSNETIAGQTFAGIGVSYIIYPQQPGTFKVPPAEMVVKYASDPPRSVEVHLPVSQATFEAVIPPQAADLDYFLPTTSLTITQKFDKPLTELKVGDTFTRTVTIKAARLRAMLIPPARFEAPEGMVIYAKQPVVDDVKTDRGEFVQGRRVDSATYLIQREGNYTLPEMRVTWWNLTARRVESATASAIHLTAESNPGYRPELAPEPDPAATPSAPRNRPFRQYLRWGEFAAISLFVLGLIFWVWLRIGTVVRQRWNERRRIHKNSEAAYFRKLRKACRADSANDAYALLLAWLNRFAPTVPLSQFLSQVAEGDLAREVEALSAGLYGRSGATVWSGRRMIAALQRVRTGRGKERRGRAALPPLNPHTRPYI